jgi:hypothetical protein
MLRAGRFDGYPEIGIRGASALALRPRASRWVCARHRRCEHGFAGSYLLGDRIV